MPRKGVPYGGGICSLKERIAEIWDKLGEKLHSINGVQGDGQGNVQIVSGDPAVVIANDAAQNKIKIALDNSKLPSAAVIGVNGKTGAVALRARDIPTRGTANVQTDINALNARLKKYIEDFIAEREARQNADAALQTNINAVQAGIPAAAAAAVAADPTVAQLAVDVPNKVDKITSGNSLKAYTHTGSAQNETAVTDDTAADSIAIRNAQGRLQAADPASGATDKTLATTNWISQTGDSSPNNIAHKVGDETWKGTKTFASDSIFKNTIISKTEYSRTEANGKRKYVLSVFDKDGQIYGGISFSTDDDGKTHIGIYVYDADGTWHGKNLI